MVQALIFPTVDEGLIDNSRGTWDIGKLRSLYSMEAIKSITNLSLSKLGCADTLIWTQNTRGSYTCKDGYTFLCQQEWHRYPRLELVCRCFLGKTTGSLKCRNAYCFSLGNYGTLLSLLQLLSGSTISKLQVVANFVKIQGRIEIMSFSGAPSLKLFGLVSNQPWDLDRFFDIECWLYFWMNKWRNGKEEFTEVWCYILATLATIWHVRNKALWQGEKPNFSIVTNN